MISVQAKLKSFFVVLFLFSALLRAKPKSSLLFYTAHLVSCLFPSALRVFISLLFFSFFCIALYTHTRLALYWNELVPT